MTDPDKLLEQIDPQHPNVDPLEQRYRSYVTRPSDRIESLRQERTALLCIDMQFLDAARGYGIFAEGSLDETPPEAQDYYFDMLDRVVIPNLRRLQDGFRAAGLEVIHIRIQSLTREGRDRSLGHKRLGLHAPPGSKEAEFLPQVAPKGDEIVINKTASGVFNSTNIEYVLNNLGIDSIYLTGVLTDECVSTAARDACDRGFAVTVIEDACASVTPERHAFTIATLKDRYAQVLDTDQALGTLRRHVAA